MWKQFWELFRRVLTLAETTEANKAEIKKTENTLNILSAKNAEEHQALWSAIERLAYELRRLNDNLEHESQRFDDKLDNSQKREVRERENLLLKIENQLLKATRQLPPQSDDKDGNQ